LSWNSPNKRCSQCLLLTPKDMADKQAMMMRQLHSKQSLQGMECKTIMTHLKKLSMYQLDTVYIQLTHADCCYKSLGCNSDKVVPAKD
jgi:hypothetical protein